MSNYLVSLGYVAYMNDDPLLKLQNMHKIISDRKQVIENIEESFSDLDTTMNFKVNSSLKAEFDTLCKKKHSNPSREIKFFMLKSIKNGRLD